MIVIDTSVWIGHLRTTDPVLTSLLDDDKVLMHPWIIGELALGSIKDRLSFLDLLSCLPQVDEVPFEQQLALVESAGLSQTGLGWVDVQILAACHDYPCKFYTLDTRLAEVAQRLGLAWNP